MELAERMIGKLAEALRAIQQNVDNTNPYILQLIEKKKVAEQEAQAQEVANAQALRNAENNLKVKQLEAEANKVMTESLTENILLKQYIEKWDGKLPQVQGSTSTMIQLPKAE